MLDVLAGARVEVGVGLALDLPPPGLLGKPPPEEPEHPQAPRNIVSRANKRRGDFIRDFKAPSMEVRTRAPFRFGWLLTVFALYLCLAAVYAYLGTWRYTIFRAGVDDCIFAQVIDSAFTRSPAPSKDP